MDGPDPKRNKKSDKAKRNFDLTGGISSKHIRLQQALMESRSKLSTIKEKKK